MAIAATSIGASSVSDPLGPYSVQQPAAPPPSNELAPEDFLTLMVTQLQNQDPTNPVDTAEYFNQMSMMTMVQGITEMKDAMEAMMASTEQMQAMQATDLIGHNVMFTGNKITLGPTGSASMQINVTEPVDNLTLNITSPSGELVASTNMGSQPGGPVAVQWDGMTSTGERLPPGTYTFTAQGTNADGEAVSFGTLTSATVQSVILGPPGQPTQLVLQGYGTVPLDSVQQVM